MARLPRLVLAGVSHIVLHRGHALQSLFIDERDVGCFTGLLAQEAKANRVLVHAYGLFADEVRLLVTPAEAPGLARMMQGVARDYSRHVNRLSGRSGSVWSGRFHSTPVQPGAPLFQAMIFVEAAAEGIEDHPVVASTADHHLGRRPSALISEPSSFWTLGNTPFEREAAYGRLAAGVAAPAYAAVREAAWKGWALGTPEFAAELTSLSGRRAAPLSRGRPRKPTPGNLSPINKLLNTEEK